MKKQPKRSLDLRRETIQQLADKKLADVAGGNPTSTVRYTHCICSNPCE